MYLKEYAKFSDNSTIAKGYATRDRYLAKIKKMHEKTMKTTKLEELKESKRKTNNEIQVLESKLNNLHEIVQVEYDEEESQKYYEETMNDEAMKRPI